MGKFYGSPEVDFHERLKMLAGDPRSQTLVRVSGDSLVDYLNEHLELNQESILGFRTTDSAVNEDLEIGKIIYTTGGSAPDDGSGGPYLVVAAGEGDIPMANGSELLLLPFGSLAGSDVSGSLVTWLNGTETLAEALNYAQEQIDQRVIYVASVAEIEALSLTAGVGVYLTEEGRSGEFVVKSGAPPSDPQQGIYIALANGNHAERLYSGKAEVSWFGAVGDGVTDNTLAYQAMYDLLRYIHNSRSGTFLVNGTINITEANSMVTGVVEGTSSRNTIRHEGADDLFNVTGAYNCTLYGLKIQHVGTGGVVANFAAGAFHEIHKCSIECTDATISDEMVYFRSSNTEVKDNNFSGSSPSQAAIVCNKEDNLNINSIISENYFGGSIRGVLVSRTGATGRVEGLDINSNVFINTGIYHVAINAVLNCRIVNNMLDQGSEICVRLSPDALGIDGVIVTDNYIAAAQNPTGPGGGIAIGRSAISTGQINGLVVSNNQIGYSSYGVQLDSSFKDCVIEGNYFSVIDQTAITANESADIVIANNTVNNSSPGYSLSIADGASGGAFNITGNIFKGAGGVFVNATDPFKFEVSSNSGSKLAGWAYLRQSVSGSSTIFTIPHGLSITPSVQKISITVRQASGSYSRISAALVSVSSTDYSIQVFHDVVTAGDLSVSVFGSL